MQVVAAGRDGATRAETAHVPASVITSAQTPQRRLAYDADDFGRIPSLPRGDEIPLGTNPTNLVEPVCLNRTVPSSLIYFAVIPLTACSSLGVTHTGPVASLDFSIESQSDVACTRAQTATMQG